MFESLISQLMANKTTNHTDHVPITDQQIIICDHRNPLAKQRNTQITDSHDQQLADQAEHDPMFR